MTGGELEDAKSIEKTDARRRLLFLDLSHLPPASNKQVRSIRVKMVRLRDGMWLPAEGVRTEYAEDIYDITSALDQQSVSLLCPVRQVHTRGNTLNTPTVTIVRCQCQLVLLKIGQC